MVLKRKIEQGLGLGCLLAACCFGYSSASYAAAFQLFDESGASVGDYHAGAAAEASDASTEYYNPAGLTRIHDQQMSVGGVAVLTDIRYRGRAQIANGFTGDVLSNVDGKASGTGQGGGLSLIPNFHYAAPINDRLAFGFGVDVPFGLATDWSKYGYVRYGQTKTSLQAISVGPSLGFKVNPQWSVGAGIDFEYMKVVFDQTAALGTGSSSSADMLSDNRGHGWGYGGHVGLLWQPSQRTRVGLTYHSQVAFNLTGTSKLYGLTSNTDSINFKNNSLTSDIIVPAMSMLSAFHQLTKRWDVMATVMYTQWSIFNKLKINNVMDISGGLTPITIPVTTINEGFHNTWNFAVGAHYKPSEDWLVKFGMGFDHTPTNSNDRNLRLPDANRLALAVGGHYQATKQLGVDLGWTHLIVNNASVHNTSSVGEGSTKQDSRFDGTASSNGDILGLQVTWNFA